MERRVNRFCVSSSRSGRDCQPVGNRLLRGGAGRRDCRHPKGSSSGTKGSMTQVSLSLSLSLCLSSASWEKAKKRRKSYWARSLLLPLPCNRDISLLHDCKWSSFRANDPVRTF